MQGWFAKFTLYLPTSEAYISAKYGVSPGKPRMFLCSFNVAGVVFKKRNWWGGREGLVLLRTFLDWNVTDIKTLQTRASPAYTTLQHSHIFLCPAYIYLKKCSWFLLPSGLCGYCKFNLLDKTLETPTQVGSFLRSTVPTLEDSVLTANPNTRSSLCLALATSNLVSQLRRSIKAHMHTRTDTHIISSCPGSWLPRYVHLEAVKGWLKCTG